MATVDRFPLGSGVLKDLNRLRRSPHGWGQKFYKGLLKRAGFLPRERGKHTIYVDPDDHDNVVIVPRHGELLSYVADQTIEAIEKRAERLRGHDQ